MASEFATKILEVASEIKPDLTGSNVDIDKRIDVNRSNSESQEDNVDIGKRIDVNRSNSELQKNEVDIGKRMKLDVRGDQVQQEKKNLEPRHENVNGHEQYYDDNGKLYRVDNDLKSDTEYEINGYKYTTDDQGRITSASGILKLKEKGRPHLDNRRDSMEVVGRGDQKLSDDKGHLIGDQFNGTNGLENMVPQDSKINRGDYKKFEGDLSKEVDGGKQVYVDVQPVYSEGSGRPDAFVVTYSIDGEVGMRVFTNGQEVVK